MTTPDNKAIAERLRAEVLSKVTDRWHCPVCAPLKRIIDELDPPPPQDIAEQAFENICKQKPIPGCGVWGDKALEIAREAIRLHDAARLESAEADARKYADKHHNGNNTLWNLVYDAFLAGRASETA